MKTKGTTVTSRLVSIAVSAGFLAASSCLSSLPASSQNALHTKTPLHMPQGAFLRNPAPDVAHLVQQVKSDPAIAIRYSRLFHLPVKMVPLAFEQMHLKKLAADHIMQVHYVKGGLPAKEELVFKMRLVRAGTPVYCLPDGTPILVCVCGNPIRTRVTPEFYNSAPVPNFNPRERLLPRTPAISSTAINPDVPRLALVPPTPLPVITIVPATDVLPVTLLPIAPALPPAALRAASLPPVYTWAHHHNDFSGLGGLPFLGLLSLLDSGQHRGIVPVVPISPLPVLPSAPSLSPSPSSGTPPVIPTVPVTPIIVPLANVPEPGVLTVGLVSLLGAWYVRYRRRR